MRVISLVALLSVLVASPGASLAQESAPAPPAGPEAAATPAVEAPPAPVLDTVHLTNGGLLRGTISEYIPGDHVVIVTIAGETRRILAAEIASVSTAAAATPTPVPEAANALVAPLPVATPELPAQPAATLQPAVSAKGARFRFESSQPGLILHRRAATALGVHASALTFEPICSAPCQTSLPAGSHALAISSGGNTPLSLDAPTFIQGGETFDGVVHSRKLTRITLMFVGGLVGLTGLVLALSAPDNAPGERGLFHNRQRTAGFVLGVVGIGFGVTAPIFVHDRAELKLRPAPAR